MVCNQWKSPFLTAIVVSLLSACGGGGGGGGGNSSAVAPSIGNDESTDSHDAFAGGFPAIKTTINNNAAMLSCNTVLGPKSGSSITGQILYERVPLFSGGLAYASTVNAPARGVVVEAVEASGGSCGSTVVDTTLTDTNGDYGLIVPNGEAVCVQARAQMFKSNAAGASSWDFQVSDNTQSNSPYYLTDTTPATPAADPVRNLLAGSGWNTSQSSYTQTRSAAPFAILDSICHALDMAITADGQLDLPALHLRWSKNNNTAEGNVSDGDVGGAYFSVTSKINSSGNIIDQAIEILLLGDDGVDTDEYDQHVITHEFAHFLSAMVSRSDSLGGSHGLGDKLDMTVAFDEGWGDAFSGIALEAAPSAHVPTPHVYQDTYGSAQLNVFKFNLETGSVGIKGWFNESSVYQIFYNLFDAADGSGFDQLSVSFPQMYDSLVSIRNSKAFNSIYTYIDQLKSDLPASASAIDNLVAHELITVTDEYGTGQGMPSGLGASDSNDVVPVYADLPTGVSQTVCSNTQFGAFNKLSVVRYVAFDAPSSRVYSFSLSPDSGGAPSLEIYRSGNYIDGESSSNSSTINLNVSLAAGEHVLMVYDTDNFDEEASPNIRECFTLRID